ncbi:hypothetical protein V8B97DRAFT_2024095 [Scleroderma yunnanense]
MPPKHKHNSKTIPSSQPIAEDNLFNLEPALLGNTEPNKSRHSSHIGKATQGQPVNPMAPSYSDNDQDDQILSWAVELTSSQEQDLEAQSSFIHFQPSQPFSFRLPSQATTSTGGMQSIRSYTPPKQLSQLCMLAMAWNHPSEAPQCNSHIHTPSSQPSSAESHTIFARNTEVDPDGDSLVIDEVSPSKDDHFTESIVHGKGGDPSLGDQLGKESSQFGTLQSQDNYFHGSTTTQNIPKTSCLISHSKVDDLDNLEALIHPPISKMSSSTDVTPTPHPAPSVTSGIMPNSNSDPSQLHFYTLLVHDIIECAKQISHCDIVSVNSFPPHPQYIPNITKLLLEDLGNWQSVLKKKAHTFICEHYEWDPQNHCPANTKIARKLLDHGNFLKHGVDVEGHTNNPAHPTLSGLIIDFFYTGTNAIASIFPEVFKNKVPHAAVVFTATTIKVALDEMVVEGKEVMFKHDIYVDVYVDVLSLIVKCDTAPIHCAKTKALHVQWVKIGRNDGTTGTTTGFDVDLD